MSDRELFWRRVDAALDERRDPLDDPEVQRLAAEHPELLDELARLRAALAHLPDEPRKRSTRRVASFAAAAALLATLALAWWLRRDREPPVEALAPPAPQTADASRVLSFRAELVWEDAAGRTTTVVDGAHVSRTRESYVRGPSTDDRTTPAFVAVVQSSSSVR